MTNLVLNARDVRAFTGHIYPPRPNAILAKLERLAQAIFVTHGERMIRRELEARPDRMLADIGITRDEIPAFARHAARRP